VGDLPAGRLSELDITRVKRAMQGHAAATVWNALELLRRIVNFGARADYCPPLTFVIKMPHKDNEIGAAYKDKDINSVVHKIAHAALGGALAAANGQDAASGALGAVVGEVTAEAFLANKLKTGISKADMPALEELGINYGKLAAGLVAALSGADVGTASMTADNAVRNNWAESAWDLLFVFWDLGKIQYGRYIDDKGMVQEGFIDLAVDSAALLIPMVPAGMTRLARAGKAAEAADKTTDAIKVADEGVGAAKAYKHSFEYNPRVRERALNDPVGHNFPYSFDDVILSTKPTRQANGSDLIGSRGL